MEICDTCTKAKWCFAATAIGEGECLVFELVDELKPQSDETKFDPSSRYYDAGGLEVQEIIRAKLTKEQYEGFCLGNILKYACRANFKGSKARDIEKVGFYARFLDEHLKEAGQCQSE